MKSDIGNNYFENSVRKYSIDHFVYSKPSIIYKSQAEKASNYINESDNRIIFSPSYQEIFPVISERICRNLALRKVATGIIQRGHFTWIIILPWHNSWPEQ